MAWRLLTTLLVLGFALTGALPADASWDHNQRKGDNNQKAGDKRQASGRRSQSLAHATVISSAVTIGTVTPTCRLDWRSAAASCRPALIDNSSATALSRQDCKSALSHSHWS